MTFYEDLVMQTQANYSRYHSVYAAGDTPYALTERAQMCIRDRCRTMLPIFFILYAECFFEGNF